MKLEGAVLLSDFPEKLKIELRMRLEGAVLLSDFAEKFNVLFSIFVVLIGYTSLSVEVVDIYFGSS